MNGLDVLILIVVAAAMFFAVRRIIRNKKAGRCCGNCSGCTEAKNCVKYRETK